MSAAVIVARSPQQRLDSESASPTHAHVALLLLLGELDRAVELLLLEERENSGANRRVSPCDRRIWYSFWKALVHE